MYYNIDKLIVKNHFTMISKYHKCILIKDLCMDLLRGI